MRNEVKLGAMILIILIFLFLVGFVIGIFVYPEIFLEAINKLIGGISSINWKRLLPFLGIVILIILVGFGAFKLNLSQGPSEGMDNE